MLSIKYWVIKDTESLYFTISTLCIDSFWIFDDCIINSSRHFWRVPAWGHIVAAKSCKRAQIRSKTNLGILSLWFNFFDKVKVKRRKGVKKCKSDALLAKWFRLLPGISETNETKKVSNDLNVHNMKCCSVQEVSVFFNINFQPFLRSLKKRILAETEAFQYLNTSLYVTR